MRSKTTRVISDSHLSDEIVPLTLAPLAIEDLTDTPVYSLTPTGRAEVIEHETIPLTPLLVKRLEEFKAAREAREKAPKGELGKAIAAEDMAALNVAWALENLINQERGS